MIDNKQWYSVTDDVFHISEEYHKKSSILDDPRAINDYLSERVYGQPEATKACSMFLYNHLHGNNKKNRCMALVGPSGSGKNHIWTQLMSLLDEYGDGKNKIVIVDTSSVSISGYEGPSPKDFLYDLEEDVSYIVVLDEICKMIDSAKYSRYPNALMGEYLSMVDPSHTYLKITPPKSLHMPSKEIKISTFSWVFSGAFSERANDIVKESAVSGLGFGMTASKEQAYSKPLTLRDLIDYGLSYELAGRIGCVVNLKPFKEEDYVKLLTEFGGGPINMMEKVFNLPEGFIQREIIDDERLMAIANECSKMELGVRAIYTKIQEIINDYIFEHFETYLSVKLDDT